MQTFRWDVPPESVPSVFDQIIGVDVQGSSTHNVHLQHICRTVQLASLDEKGSPLW